MPMRGFIKRVHSFSGNRLHNYHWYVHVQNHAYLSAIRDICLDYISLRINIYFLFLTSQLALEIVAFGLPFYFISGLAYEARAFFVYLAILIGRL